MKDIKDTKRQVDMLNGSLFSRMLMVAIPLAASNILQQLFNAADSVVVGRFSSSEALAAVGGNGPVINMIVALFSGIAVGANVLISSYIGKNEKGKVSRAVHTGIAIALISGVAMMILGLLIARPVHIIMQTPDNVLDMATVYLRIYFLGMPAIIVYNFGAAIFRSVGDTKRPLYCLFAAGILNVILNLFFILVAGMSADGVALATTISNYLSAGAVIVILMREKSFLHLDFKKLTLSKADASQTLKVGVPAGLQGALFSLSNVMIQIGINKFGSDCTAGNSAAMNFEFIAYFVVASFAQSATTFMSQNYAAGQYDRCRKITKIAMAGAVGFCAVLSITFGIFRVPLLGIITDDPSVIAFGATRMLLITMLEPMTASYEVTGASLRGFGHSLSPAIISLIGCCVVRLIYMLIIFNIMTEFWQLLIIYPISWVITGTGMIVTYIINSRKAFGKVEAA